LELYIVLQKNFRSKLKDLIVNEFSITMK
jgi:hypothetical protein